MKKLLIGLGVIIAVIIVIVIIRRNGANPMENFVVGEAQVENVDVVLLETFPVSVSVTATGQLPDSCTELGDIIQSRNENGDFVVTIQTRRPVDAQCAQFLSDFSSTFMLEGVDGLMAGQYTVSVNGAVTTFTFDVDNFISDFDPLK